MSNYKVGDKLAFRYGYGKGRLTIRAITKITPSGRIRCGNIEMNPDLTIRGARAIGSAYCGEPVTDKIAKQYKRQCLKDKIDDIRSIKLTDDQMERIASIIDKANPVCGPAETDRTIGCSGC